MVQQFFILSEEAVKRIDRLLLDLVETAEAEFVQVVDRSGYVIAKQGRLVHVHPEELGAIAAGVLSAMQMIANLAETNESTLKFHSQNMTNFHFIWITPRIFLLVAFRSSVDETRIRSKARRVADQIRTHVPSDETQPSEMRSVQFIEDKLSEMFQDL